MGSVGVVILFIGYSSYILGFLFVFFSLITLVMGFFAANANPAISLFALLQGFMAMGNGKIVITTAQKNK
ncbi:hypothetical protein [Sediminibacillus halophilus]|uniref:Uncharacterized protein n=1 Tax=Sediminibacillus halophilus TaxID=482461 RepID=A0A1G9S8Q5_9BACI|nr:hypothetical protein [Sediminibacillus halophilus]SDM31175.1 hypothetical protein SAMN05216244_2310 [Sediminibacillus halophilus]